MAAGVTYTPIASNTVSGSTTSTVALSSISNSYTDLIVVTNLASTATFTLYCYFNADTSNNYSGTYIYGNGTSAISGRQSSAPRLQIDIGGIGTAFSNSHILQVFNYANTTTYKSSLVRSNEPNYVGSWCGLWRSTSAINSLTFFTSANYFAAGSTFALYGVTAA